MTTSVRAALVFVCAAACIAESAWTQTARSGEEQAHFSAEDVGVRHPVAIPEDAWAILQADERVKRILDSEGLTLEQLPRTWFSAAVVHLHDPGQDDLIVWAEGELAGGNISPFWLFVRTPTALKLALQASTHDLAILRNRWKGYRVIETEGATCCENSRVWLRFEGGVYRDYRHSYAKVN